MISTVATFSTKADMSPVMTRIATMAMPRVGEWSTIRSAIQAGTREKLMNETYGMQAPLLHTSSTTPDMWPVKGTISSTYGFRSSPGGIGSTYIYFEFGYKGGLYSIFTTVGMSATAFLMPA